MSACATTIERAPVADDPDVLLETTGTVLLAERGDGLLNRSVTLIDLPSGARRELRLPSNFSDLSGIDERGRLAYIEAGVEAPRLLLLEIASKQTRPLLELDRAHRALQLAPRGDWLVLWKTLDGAAELVSTDDSARRPIAHDLGRLTAVHWRPDGRSFSLVGEHASAQVDVATLTLTRRTPILGPFTPRGEAQLATQDGEFVLIDAESGATLVEPAHFPWPAESVVRPLALPGPHHGRYHSLPAAGDPSGQSFARGGVLWHENGVLAIADLASGQRATLAAYPASISQVLYSPVRLAELARE